MNFISITYGLFLLSVLGIYWSVANQTARLWTLLISSIVFYASFHIDYIPLLLVLTWINFRLGKEIGSNILNKRYPVNRKLSYAEWQFAQSDWNRRRLTLLWLGVSLNVVLLLGFKYLQPALAYLFNMEINSPNSAWRLIAPVGISYFIFECIAYLVDVYRGAPATKSFLKFASYKLFFAKLLSGPITRYHSLASQFYRPEFPSPQRLTEALWLISRGAFKKAILADNLAIFVDLCFGNLQRAGSADLWLATFAYGWQLYLDFSGYVDMVRGTALLFGLVLPENFNFPYFSTSIADFWRRWHITLGDWLRNYVYFPLGGSRQGLTPTCWNLFIVMVIAGIWHGSTWGFVVWGALHGLALVIHRLTDAMSDVNESFAHFWQNPLGIVIAWFFTQLMVFTSWIWFRLPNIQDSSWVIQHLWGHTADIQFVQKVYVEALNMNQYQMTAMLVLLTLMMSIIYLFNAKLKLELNWPVKLGLIPLCFYAVWLLAPEGGLPYIYFDF